MSFTSCCNQFCYSHTFTFLIQQSLNNHNFYFKHNFYTTNGNITQTYVIKPPKIISSFNESSSSPIHLWKKSVTKICMILQKNSRLKTWRHFQVPPRMDEAIDQALNIDRVILSSNLKTKIIPVSVFFATFSQLRGCLILIMCMVMREILLNKRF